MYFCYNLHMGKESISLKSELRQALIVGIYLQTCAVWHVYFSLVFASKLFARRVSVSLIKADVPRHVCNPDLQHTVLSTLSVPEKKLAQVASTGYVCLIRIQYPLKMRLHLSQTDILFNIATTSWALRLFQITTLNMKKKKTLIYNITG